MTPQETEQLLRRAAEDDPQAVDRLMAAHRRRLKQMITVRMDQRLRQRLDPSDVVQETLLEAARRLPDYLSEDSIPFYPWLRQMAVNRLIDLHRRHLVSQKRSVRREGPAPFLPDESVMQLATRLAAPGSSPSRHAQKQEQRERVKEKLGELDPGLKEVLVLQYLEELSTNEIAPILGVSERTVRRWHRQAIEQLGDLLTR